MSNALEMARAAFVPQDEHDVHNVIQPVFVPRVHLRLRFRDPEGIVRDFPAGYPVTVRFLAPAALPLNVVTQQQGVLAFDCPWKKFTLEFTSAQVPYVLCEAPGAALSPPQLKAPGEIVAASQNGQRYFALPLQWSVSEGEWSPPAFPVNGAFSPPGTIRHTLSPPADMGSLVQPEVLVLEGQWQFLRYEFFDRRYGRDHARRITTPPVTVEGFRASPPVTADARSNWTIGASADDRTQCLPWVRKNAPSGAPLPQLDRTMTLQFTTPASSFVRSDSAAARSIVQLDPVGDANTLAPGPNRLRYYDLPALWRSKRYYTRFTSPPEGVFFHHLDTAQIARSARADKPMVFSLDDVVLSDALLNPLPAAGNPMIFSHRFLTAVSPPPQVSPPLNDAAAATLFGSMGVYKPGTVVSERGYPYSDVALGVRSYIHDYPDWTRLVVADGNLFDVFDRRTPDVGIGAVAGARAGVRWINATSPPHGVPPRTTLDPRPALVQHPFFSIQPFYQQNYLLPFEGHNPQAAAIFHDEWAGAYPTVGTRIGRFDIAHLRCCDSAGGREISLLFRFNRFSFDLNANTLDGGRNVYSPTRYAGPRPYDSAEWTRRFVTGVNARWSGLDPHNPDVAWIEPRTVPPQPLAPALRTQVMTLVQYLDRPRAHYLIMPGVPTLTSGMHSALGVGQLRANAVDHDHGTPPNLDAWGGKRWPGGRGMAAPHEAGHCASHPDEYRTDKEGAAGYLSLHLLGNPYVLDKKAMMFGNWYVRARYFWHAAEWLRVQPPYAGTDLKIAHGADENDYWQPHYPHAGANPARNAVNWPVRFNLRQRPPGGPMINFDSALYLLGDDQYSSQILPLIADGGVARIDGIAVVIVRIKIDLTLISPPFPDTVRDDICRLATNKFNNLLNVDGSRRVAAIQLVSSPPLPDIQRCMIHFVPAFLTDIGVGYPEAKFNRAMPEEELHVRSPEHLFVLLSPAAVHPGTWVNASPPLAKRAVVPCLPDMTRALSPARYDASVNRIAQIIVLRTINTLGLSATQGHPTNYRSPPAYIPIIQTVVNNAAAPPIVT